MPEISDWDSRVAVLGDVRDWDFSGRVGVKAGDDGFNGSLRWSQRGERFTARVGGPLGVGTVSLEGNGRAVELTDKDGVRTVLEDAERDLYFRYGWTIPVESLRYWALGIPDPGFEAVTGFDAAGRLERLEQRNWVVEVKSYSDGGGQLMPRRLSASNTDTRVRIVIDNWSFY